LIANITGTDRDIDKQKMAWA